MVTFVKNIGSNDMYVPYAKDIEDELTQCEKALNFKDEELDELNNPEAKSKITKRMRIKLREKEFETWSQMRLRGAGVCQFKDNPNGNKLLMNKRGLTTSEWVTSLKMNANVSSVRVIPGRSLDGTQCRHCGAEKESLGHVLGSCVRGELIRNSRRNGIREILAKACVARGFVVEQEVHCVAENGSTRRVEIIAYCPSSKTGYILDPTIRLEFGDSEEQATAVDLEKKEIDEPCAKYFREKWGLRSVEVVGLYVGARGTITTFFKTWAKSFGILQTVLDDILLFALRGSIQIYNHHQYI